jgi:hypothetical protein
MNLEVFQRIKVKAEELELKYPIKDDKETFPSEMYNFILSLSSEDNQD